MRRRLPTLLAVPAVALPLALSGCGSGEGAGTTSGSATGSASGSAAATGQSSPSGTSTGPTGSASPAAAAGLPTVEGAPGAAPTVKAPPGAPGSQLVAEVISEGSGPEVAKGNLLVANYVGQTWRENKKFDSSYDRNAPVAFPIGTGQVIPGWDEGLVGRKVGSRVLLVIPPDKGYGSSGQPQAGIQPDDTLVFAVDIVASHAPTEAASASAAAVPAPAGLPTVTAAAGAAGSLGKPEITIPAGAKPPKALRTAVLVEGTGPAVEKGKQLVAQYVGVTWRDGKEFDSSWKRQQLAAFPIGTGQVIPGWDEALVGAKAGSRLLLSIPPDKGYGKEGQAQAGIKGNDTLVFVVDVIGAY